MPANLGALVNGRPNTACIFASDPATLAGVLAVVINLDVAIPLPGRVRLDLTHSHNASRRAVASRSPVERATIDNIRREPIAVTISGSISATPLGPIATQLGGFGSFLRRDLREVEKLRKIQERNEPVILVTGQIAYPPMVMSIDEVHTGENKVDLTLSFEEIRIISPISVQGILDLAEAQVGAQAQANAGAQPVETVEPPADLAEPTGEDIGVDATLANLEGLGA